MSGEEEWGVLTGQQCIQPYCTSVHRSQVRTSFAQLLLRRTTTSQEYRCTVSCSQTTSLFVTSVLFIVPFVVRTASCRFCQRTHSDKCRRVCARRTIYVDACRNVRC